MGRALRTKARTENKPSRDQQRDPNALLFRGATVVTCDAADSVLRADVLVEHGRISRVGKVRPSYPVEVIDAKERLILPGLVMAHVSPRMSRRYYR